MRNREYVIFERYYKSSSNIWFTDKGETEITEAGQQKGDLADDFQTYEVQREFGVAVELPQYQMSLIT